MPDLTNQQLLDTLRQEFVTKKYFDEHLDERLEKFATKDDLSKSLTRLERKLDDHRDISKQRHLRVLTELGHLNRQLTTVTDRQDELEQRFDRLRIVSE